MIKTLGLNDFIKAFEDYDREDNFSYDGLDSLFSMLESCEDSENPTELDVIALYCDYAEDDIDGIINDYNIDVSETDDTEDDEERENEQADIVEEFLNNSSWCAKIGCNRFVYQQF